MNFQELIRKRYSVRTYRDSPVEEEKLLKILEAARLAPTACNCQPFQLIVMHTTGKQEEILSICNNDWLSKAPLILFVCGVPSEAWVRRDGKQYLDVDIAIVMDHMVLAATELGLGTCIIGAFDVENARKVLSVPDDVEPLLFTPLGYAADEPGKKQRKSLDELVRYERW